MDELKRFVVEDVPVDELPEIVRRSIEGTIPSEVRITVEFEVGSSAAEPRRSLRSFIGAAQGLYSGPDEIVDYIRKLRDESDR